MTQSEVLRFLAIQVAIMLATAVVGEVVSVALAPATADLAVTSDVIADSAIVVRGGVTEIPAGGEPFSASYGSTVDEAAAGVPHGQIRVTTAGEIRAGGGTVEYAPEINDSVGATNYQHVDICLGVGSCPFGPLAPNPVPKPFRFGGPSYPYSNGG